MTDFAYYIKTGMERTSTSMYTNPINKVFVYVYIYRLKLIDAIFTMMSLWFCLNVTPVIKFVQM